MHSRAKLYIGLTLFILIIFWAAQSVAWQGSTQLHTLVETAATLLALMVGLVALTHFYANKNNSFLFIGTGFLGTALLDGYHTLVTSEWFNDLWPSPPPSLIPWSWNASRIFLALLMVLSWWAWRREERLGRKAGQISEKNVYAGMALLTAASFTFFALVPLPVAYYPELVVGRPGEWVAAVLFTLALVGYLQKQAWHRDPFEHWLVLSLVVGVMTQALVMAFSFRLFDIMFSLAHILKVVSYICVLTGLLTSMYRLFRQARQSAQTLSQVNESLRLEITARKNTQLDLQKARDELEQRVTERTRELSQANAELKNEVTERRQIEAALQESEERFRFIAEATPVPLFISSISDGTILFANRQFGQAFGLPGNELVGQPAPNWYHNPADRQALLARLTQEGKLEDYEVRLRKPGQETPFWVSATISPITFAGEAAMLGAFFDITERKLAEKKLRQSEKRFRALIQNLSDIIVLVSADGKILYESPAVTRVLGHNPEERVGTNAFERVHPDDIEGVISIFEQILRQPEQDVITQLRIRHKDGSWRWVEAVGSNLLDEPAVQAIVANYRDITEHKRAEKALATYAKELERSNAELERFAYVASHDLQEPLRMITSYLQLLQRRYQDQIDADANEFIDFAVEGALRLRQLINGLLAYSRIGTQEKNYQPVDGQAALEAALTNLQVAIKESRAKLIYDPLPTVIADESQLVQLFQNLVSNAIKFCGDWPPEIRITAGCRDGETTFSVADNGVGIEPEFIDQIFVLFKRLHNQVEVTGAGIGLATCKKIVEQHGGRIWVESEPGNGTTFYFTLMTK